jgi:hypothetical protein
MKLKITATTLLLAAVAGVSLSYADQMIPGQSENVPVTISGSIVLADDGAPGCNASSTEGLTLDMSNNDGELDWKPASEDRFTLERVSAGDINIICEPGANTDITFKTNNDFNEGASQGAQYGSWPVIIVNNSSAITSDNFQEAVINGYLTTVTCTGGSTSCAATKSNLNNSMITADNQNGTTAQEITASITGQLYASAPVFGEVQSSPRSPNPELYVIYDGKSSSQIPLNLTP